MPGWEPHPTQVDRSRGSRAGYPKYLHGPLITPQDFEDGLYSRACCIVGHCDQGAHDRCWQADDVPPPDHALDACDKTHELRCRCDCHERSAADDGLLFL